MTNYANGDVYMCGSLAVLGLVGLAVMFWPKVSAAARAIRSAEQPDFEPEDFDEHCERALLPWQDASAAEDNPLLREIYAAQSLARDGVDVYAKAPKEFTP